MNTKRLLLAAGVLSIASVVSMAQPALASQKISVVGLGAATVTASGGYDYAGTLHGSPFPGAFTGGLSAADSSLPAVGECEAGRANLRVQDTGGRFYDLVSTGQVCAYFLPLGVMHQFTGRWSVASTNIRRLARADGHVDIRILNDQSDIYAKDT